jgi:hypothetical protein
VSGSAARTRFAAAVIPAMTAARISAYRIAKGAGVQVKCVKRVLRGTSSPCDELTSAFAEMLELDVKWLRKLRGLDRAEAMRTLKRMKKVRGPLQKRLEAQWDAPIMRFMRYFVPEE